MTERARLTLGFRPSTYGRLRIGGQEIGNFWTPCTDASMDEQSYEIAIELPGVPAQDIDVSFHDRHLVIRGTKGEGSTVGTRTALLSERVFGEFVRSFELPDDCDPEGALAELDSGVLTVTVPRRTSSASAGSRHVPVRTG